MRQQDALFELRPVAILSFQNPDDIDVELSKSEGSRNL